MNDHIVVIGTGEMSGVFARGLLKLGHPVIPVTRQTDMDKLAIALAPPVLVLVAVGEADLHPVLGRIPAAWQDRLVLLQNELLPRDWAAHGLQGPTVISVWFEKKKGQDYKVLVPSPVYGHHAPLIERAMESLGIPCWELASEAELEFELVRKNVYILTSNISGLLLPPGTTVDTLWNAHQALARQIANEVMDIQFKLIGHELDREKLIAGMVEGILGDPAHVCTGRSAPARLARNLGFADEAGLAVPTLREIQAGL
ncbi:MAG: hypothetical protein K0A95_09795 [Chromatiales bacterium]|nr:hypothetical protein [Gammaproteobacteria bacterium]MBW6477351.1 hypothetical protein [Chromatiales bacterium]